MRRRSKPREGYPIYAIKGIASSVASGSFLVMTISVIFTEKSYQACIIRMNQKYEGREEWQRR